MIAPHNIQILIFLGVILFLLAVAVLAHCVAVAGCSEKTSQEASPS